MRFFDDEIAALKAEGLFRTLRTLDGSVLNFCSNDYLGLSQDPRLAEAAMEATRRHGAGSGAARLISGNRPLFEQLEASLRDLKGTEDVLLFSSGYHANIGAIPALAREGDLIFSDELNHASLIDGCRLSKAKTVVYRHNDLNHLENLLKGRGAVSAPGRGNPAPTRTIIVTEAVFSMEGDVCPFGDLLALADRYGALLFLDEAHAVGVLGEVGEGLAPRKPPENVICMGTLGKALGSYGAFVSGSKSLRDLLINKARSFLFTTALPPSVPAAALAAVRIVREEPERREKLWKNVKEISSILGAQGLATRNGGASPIFSIPFGPAAKAMEVSSRLLERGVYVQGIRPPTVPEGTSRLRLTVSAAHTTDQIEKLKSALADVGAR